jgi:hypothetical protein
VEAAGAAQIEGFGPCAEDGGQDAGAACQAARLACGDGDTALERRDPVGGELVEEGVVVDGDDEFGVGAAVAGPALGG